jgi:hypothetical protein
MSLDVELENDAAEGVPCFPHAVHVRHRTVSMLQLFNGKTCRFSDSTVIQQHWIDVILQTIPLRKLVLLS